MTKYREVLRMSAGGFSQRVIASTLSMSRNTVASTLKRAREQNLDWEAVEQQRLSEKDIANLLFPDRKKESPYQIPDFEYMAKELKKTGVSLQMLWLEYCEGCRSYLACAVGREACRQLYSVRFTRMRTLLEDLKMASEFQEQKIKRELLNCNLLIIDDYMLSAIDETETALLYELIHDRELSDRTSTILCTQYDLKGCAMKMKGQTMSDAIYDRLEHNAYIINLSQNPKTLKFK